MISLKKFKWLYGSVESYDTLMQEFYRIVQGKNEKVQTFILHLERGHKAIKQQDPYAITEEESVKHLKDHLFHGLSLTSTMPSVICMISLTPNTVSW